jgi:hypothetical protein
MQVKEGLYSHYWKFLLYFAAVGLLLLGCFALHARLDQPLLGPTDYQLSGSFAPYGVPAATRWLHKEDMQFSLGSQSENNRERGAFISRTFSAPATLNFLVSGYPNAEGNRLYLEAVPSAEKLDLGIVNEPGSEWRHYYWKLPKPWRGRTIRLVAENHAAASPGWLGLTLPHGGTAADEIKTSLSRVVFVVSSILLEAAVFLLPGIALAWLLNFKYKLDELRFVYLTLLGSAAAGYLVFWVYLLSARAGKDTAKAVVLASLMTVVYAILKRRADKKLFKEVAICALLMVILTAFYTGLGFLYEHSVDPGVQAEERFVDPLPIDNMLPYFFADKLYHSQPVRPFLTIGWKSSDRPPLQAGITLLQFPLWQTQNREFSYQILGTLLQSMWLVAVWLLLRMLSVDRRAIVIVCAFCIFSRFFLINTFFVWPKLLSASFFILAILALRYPLGKVDRCAPFDAAIAGAAVGLAMLSHGGVAFSVIALTIVLLAGKKLPSLGSVGAGIAMVLLFLLPWTMYQKHYDPPGNRLLKWHLAGDQNLDSLTFGQALVQGYGKLSASQIVENKIENVKTLFGPGPWDVLRNALAGKPAAAGPKSMASPWLPVLDWYKTGTFFYVFQSPGLLDLGFFVFLLACLFSFKRGVSTVLASLRRLLLLFCVSMPVWCLLLYTPGATQIHMGSMADMTILFVALASTLALVTPRLAYTLLGLQVLILFPLFALTEAFVRPSDDVVWAGGLDPGMAGLASVGLLMIAALSWKVGFSKLPSTSPPVDLQD